MSNSRTSTLLPSGNLQKEKDRNQKKDLRSQSSQLRPKINMKFEEIAFGEKLDVLLESVKPRKP